MGKSLVIVESPAKAKTINKYLGPDYIVKSSVGHIRDLPVSGSGSQADPKERARQAALVYQAVLLDALGEVETALVTIEAIEAQSVELQRAVTASEQAFDQLNALYREGLASFIDILDAQRTLISSRQSQLESRASHAKAIISLYRALGAPVSPDPDPGSPT